MSSPSVYIKAIRDLGGKEHMDKVNAVKALQQVGIYDLPEELAAYFKTKCSDDIDFDAPGTLVSFNFDDYDARQGRKVLPPCIEWGEDDHEMETSIRIDLATLPKGTRFIDVKLSY